MTTCDEAVFPTLTSYFFISSIQYKHFVQKPNSKGFTTLSDLEASEDLVKSLLTLDNSSKAGSSALNLTVKVLLG